jgi:hypothetical protein
VAHCTSLKGTARGLLPIGAVQRDVRNRLTRAELAGAHGSAYHWARMAGVFGALSRWQRNTRVPVAGNETSNLRLISVQYLTLTYEDEGILNAMIQLKDQFPTTFTG